MTSYTETARYYARQRERKLRELLRRDYGRYRITREGTVDAYGQMPNSIVRGWYFVGYLNEVYRFYNL